MAPPLPVFDDGTVALYCGDFREVLPALDLTPDVVVADCPYGETSLRWDRWVDGWPAALAGLLPDLKAMWCFGSMRMFLEHAAEFSDWSFSHEVVWEKHNGSNFGVERFRRVHELAVHWYRGPWSQVAHEQQFTQDATARTVRRKERPPHTGEIANSTYTSVDGGPRQMRSVLRVSSMHGKGTTNETEKPTGILTPLIAYSTRPGGLVLDVFAGSGSTLRAAQECGRRAVGIELRPAQCAAAVERLTGRLDFGAPA